MLQVMVWVIVAGCWQVMVRVIVAGCWQVMMSLMGFTLWGWRKKV